MQCAVFVILLSLLRFANSETSLQKTGRCPNAALRRELKQAAGPLLVPGLNNHTKVEVEELISKSLKDRFESNFTVTVSDTKRRITLPATSCEIELEHGFIVSTFTNGTVQHRSSSFRKARRQVLGIGRARLGGCGNEQLRHAMENLLGPLLSVVQMKLGDIARRLQKLAQQLTGKSFEVVMTKRDFVVSSHQMQNTAHCRARIGQMFTLAYETPTQYNIHDEKLDNFFSSVDFGEKLGGSGLPGQKAWPSLHQLIDRLEGVANRTGGLGLGHHGPGGLLGGPPRGGPGGLLGGGGPLGGGSGDGGFFG